MKKPKFDNLKYFDRKRINKIRYCIYSLFSSFSNKGIEIGTINEYQINKIRYYIERTDFVIHGDTFNSAIAIHLAAQQLEKHIIVAPPVMAKFRKYLDIELGCFQSFIPEQKPLRNDIMFYYADRIILLAYTEENIFYKSPNEAKSFVQRALTNETEVNIILPDRTIENDRKILKQIGRSNVDRSKKENR